MCSMCGASVATFRRAACCRNAVPAAEPYEICDTCATAWACPHCGRPGTDLPRLSSGSESESGSLRSGGSNAQPSTAVLMETTPSTAQPSTAQLPTVDSSAQPVSPSDRSRLLILVHRLDVVWTDTWTPSEEANAVISRCVEQKQNTIWETLASGAEKTHVALEVSGRCLQASQDARKAVLLAPTVPLVKQHLEVAEKCKGLQMCHVIGSSKVDAWGRDGWRDLVEKHDLLITTPQLFLDVLDVQFLRLSAFCVLIVDECQHCAGSHPFARMFAEHYHLRSMELRVLGMSGNLVKRKVRDAKERDKAVRKLEKALDSHVMSRPSAPTSQVSNIPWLCTCWTRMVRALVRHERQRLRVLATNEMLRMGITTFLHIDSASW